MTDVDYRIASVLTEIPIDTLKQKFSIDEVRRIPNIVCRANNPLRPNPIMQYLRRINQHLPTGLYACRMKICEVLSDYTKLRANTICGDYKTLVEVLKLFFLMEQTYTQKNPPVTSYQFSADPHVAPQCAWVFMKYNRNWNRCIYFVQNNTKDVDNLASSKNLRTPNTSSTSPQKIVSSEDSCTTLMTSAHNENLKKDAAPSTVKSVEGGELGSKKDKEPADTFLHQEGKTFKDVLEEIQPDEIHFYTSQLSLGGLYELSKIYATSTYLYLNLIHENERLLANHKGDLEIRHQLEQREKARECKKWLEEETKGVSQVSRFTFANKPASSVVYRRGEKRGYLLGNQELTRSFLGDGEQSSFETILLSQNELAASALQKKMGEIEWKDVKKQFLEKELYEYIRWRNPNFIYYLTLWHLYQKREKFFFEEDGDLQKTAIWRKLFDYQRDGAIAILEKLETHGSCILADSVGLGKTFTALAVIMAYQRMNKNVAVFSPKNLKGNWDRFLLAHETNPFRNNVSRKSDFSFNLFAHTDLREGTWQKKDGHDLNYSLFVIDESHNFRNDGGARYKFLQDLLAKSKKTKVLMLTATPINNRVRDLKNQLKLQWHIPNGLNYGALYDLFTTKIVEVIDRADGEIKEWQERYYKKNGEIRPLRTWLSVDYFNLLKRYVVARNVTTIRENYAQFIQQRGNLPTEVYCKAVPQIADDISISEIVREFEGLSFVAYDLRGYFEEQRSVSHLLGMLKIGFLKRFESSVESARKTLDSLIKHMENTRDQVGKYILGCNNSSVINADAVEDHVDVTDDNISLENKGITVRVRKMEQIGQFESLVKKDLLTLNKIKKRLNTISPEKDLKLQNLKKRIREKMNSPVQKMLIFTAYKDTAEYLYRNICDMGYRVACVTGTSVQANQRGLLHSKEDVLRSFAPIGQELKPSANPLQILIATDCISEGQNLQDCDMVVNYDIHWNPVRLTQRNGRINRIGSPHEKITIVNYWPMQDIDEYLQIYTRIMTRTAIGGTITNENALGAEMKEFEREAFFQNQRLREMQAGPGNRSIEEAQSIRIYDTHAFAIDFQKQEQDNVQRELFKEIRRAPLGLHAVSSRPLPDDVATSIIFLLRKKSVDKNISHYENYKLVMIDKLSDGNTWHSEFSDAKILSRYQALCRENSEINKEKEEDFKNLDISKLEKLLLQKLQEEHSAFDLNQYTIVTYLIAGNLATLLKNPVMPEKST